MIYGRKLLLILIIVGIILALVCAKHFKLTDYQRFSKYLKEKAVPSIFPCTDETKVKESSVQQKPAPVQSVQAATARENSSETSKDGYLITLDKVQEQKKKREILLLSTKATILERLKQIRAKLQALNGRLM